MAGIVYSSGVGFTPITVHGNDIRTVTFQTTAGAPIGAPFQFAAVPRMSGYSFVMQQGPACSSRCQFVSYGSGNPLRLGGGYLLGPAAFPRYYPFPYSSMPFDNWAQASGSTYNDVAGASAGAWNSSTPVQGFIAVRFTSSLLAAGDHYGYFDVTYDPTPSMANGALTINGWAYETDTGASLVTTPLSSVPEPSGTIPAGLSLLALGAAGIRARRKRTA
jgi:MYXO-CTERM domain-containing protein